MDTQECCPKFDPSKWENKVFEWKDKYFIKGKVLTFFYMPLNYGSVMTKLTKIAEEENVKDKEALCLNSMDSKWTSNLYLAIDKEIDGQDCMKLSGKYISRVYEGSYQDMGKWFEDFNNYLKERKLEVRNTYTWYTTCPKCAKKYGKNYTVLIGELI